MSTCSAVALGMKEALDEHNSKILKMNLEKIKVVELDNN